METKFTKGEWYIDGTHICISNSNDLNTNETICLINPETEYHTVFERSIKEADANAKLIAAAPEMFNELLEIAEMAYSCNQIDISDEHFKRIENLLKKIAE